jgi:hypothetical protein
MNLVIERGNAVSVLPITGERSNFQVVFSHPKENEPTIVRSVDLLQRTNSDGNQV